jgi:alkylation response protein AidB-like acyl-CoA dehydrogenase
MANQADWIFCLVRTDTEVPKHDGISFILFDLKQPGVTISPIKLISGSSDFCQVFFEDVRADARNLVGQINGGWTIAKRLLQHERETLSGGMGSGNLLEGSSGDKKEKKKAPPAAPPSYLAATAKRYIGETETRISDPLMRARVAQLELDSLCFGLTLIRSGQEAKSGQGQGAASSMFKLYGSEVNKRRSEVMMSLMGAQALGWDGEGFGGDEIAHTRAWLRSKGNSIEGGTSEVQLNIISKRVLGLPD